ELRVGRLLVQRNGVVHGGRDARRLERALHRSAARAAHGVLRIDAPPVGPNRKRSDGGREAGEHRVVATRDNLSLFDFPVETLELREEYRALNRVEPPVDAEARVMVAARRPGMADVPTP